MHITQELASRLLAVYEGNNWTEVSIHDTIKDLSYRQATKVTPGSVNTVAALLHHLSYWNEVIRERMAGTDPEIVADNGFLVTITDEAGWQQLVRQAKQSFESLAAEIRHFPLEKMTQPTPSGKTDYGNTLFGIIEHAYYHMGQMVILKNMLMKP